MSEVILRPKAAAKFMKRGYSTFNQDRETDPDFRDLTTVPLGERAIGFFRHQLLKILLRKACRRAVGVGHRPAPPHQPRAVAC